MPCAGASLSRTDPDRKVNRVCSAAERLLDRTWSDSLRRIETHRQQDGAQFQIGVQFLTHQLDGAHQLGDALKRVVLAPDRIRISDAATKSVERQQTEEWWTVDHIVDFMVGEVFEDRLLQTAAVPGIAIPGCGPADRWLPARRTDLRFPARPAPPQR